VAVSIEEARGPMGMAKRDHIKTMLAVPDIADRWAAVHRSPPTDADVDKVYAAFVPKNETVAAKYARLVDGAKAAIDDLRDRGLKIGSTTGYTRSIMAHVLPVAAQQGYVPDNLVCSDDLIEGRPGPLGMYQCFVDLGVYPPSAVIKVDDTAPGIAEGVAAGCVTVGVTLSGNAVGKTPEELAAMSADEIAPLREAAAEQLVAAGADHIIDTIADLPALIDTLEADRSA
ncbi:MAG: phosphonoacetaldehyde hydrolase, partial [Pseudomonadota bacterium]